MRNLSELNLDITYRSDSNNVVKDFYVPCLTNSSLYRRAAGYFTSHGLTLAAKGIARMIKTGGELKLVVSPYLTEDDINAIELGYQSRDQVFREALMRSLEDTENELVRNRLSALAWLISVGRLDIRLAFRVDRRTGSVRPGIYHEKFGIFSDDRNNHVAFSGSQNETVGGLIENFESIDVFCSWRDAEGRIARKVRAFRDLWSDETAGLSVVEFNDVSREILGRFKTDAPPAHDIEEIKFRRRRDIKWRRDGTSNRPRIPTELKLRDYQETAVENWFRNNGTGLLEMATGTGKTITGLSIAARLSQRIDLQAMIVVCPYKHLVTQWARECARFGLVPLLAYENQASWYDDLTSQLSGLVREPDRFLCVITTNTTFSLRPFQTRIKYFPKKTLLIADEVHNLGGTKLSRVLPKDILLRLGLSATPERWFDAEGTERLRNYFGDVVKPRLRIKEAIKLGALVPYRYYPIIIKLTDEEKEVYLQLSAQIAQLFERNKDESSDERMTALLLRRARLIGAAENKLQALRTLAAQKRDATHMLIYCGDGTVESGLDQSVSRQVEEVTRILGSEYGIRVGIYVASTPTGVRDEMRDGLATGRWQGLVAIRCLDEGIDIPAVRTAVILASSTNPRQFVQRRGRVLRRYPGKNAAEIYDMIVVPPVEACVTESERSLVRKELTRFAEFADIAMNSGEARSKIVYLQKQFGLFDV